MSLQAMSKSEHAYFRFSDWSFSEFSGEQSRFSIIGERADERERMRCFFGVTGTVRLDAILRC